jgi:hypothetical protein
MDMFKTTPVQRAKLSRIANEMCEQGASCDFVEKVVDMAVNHECAYDLMVLWRQSLINSDKNEQLAILSTLEELIKIRELL